MDYQTRVVDEELDALAALPAIVLQGAKGVGKTETALQRAKTIFRLDQPGQVEIAAADPSRLTEGERPILIDEWQRFAPVWDVVRTAVDADRSGGQFLLTGSASSRTSGLHTGATRMVPLRMRPMTLPERGVCPPTVSLRALLFGEDAPVEGRTKVGLADYAAEIVASGFPGLRGLSGRALRASLDGYVDLIAEQEFPLLGQSSRDPSRLRRWMAATAAATATTTTIETLRAAAARDGGVPPARTTVLEYQRALEDLWVYEHLPAWAPSGSDIRRITGPDKHHLVDPALAARLLNVDAEALLAGGDVVPRVARTGTLLGALFESLAALSVRVFAQAAEARVYHFRTKAGEREADFIVETSARRVVAIDVKLAATIGRSDTDHLRWLRAQLGDRFAGGVVLSTGSEAYRDADGIAVVPLALLGA
ncbi:MAG: DUF4143 domain-containing protein [Chloroflexota bacterium]